MTDHPDTAPASVERLAQRLEAAHFPQIPTMREAAATLRALAQAPTWADGVRAAAAKVHWMWNADGTPVERRVAVETQKGILALLAAPPAAVVGAGIDYGDDPDPEAIAAYRREFEAKHPPGTFVVIDDPFQRPTLTAGAQADDLVERLRREAQSFKNWSDNRIGYLFSEAADRIEALSLSAQADAAGPLVEWRGEGLREAWIGGLKIGYTKYSLGEWLWELPMLGGYHGRCSGETKARAALETHAACCIRAMELVRAAK